MYDFHSNENLRTSPDIRADYEDPTIQSQYSASPIIKSLVLQFDYNIDPNSDIALFYNKIFDIETAEGIGLDIWGRIVGIGRAIAIESEDYLGFYGSQLQPYNQAPFWHGKPVSDVYELTDDAYRQLIMWKAMANISTADAATLNKLTQLLMGETTAYILESGVMAIRLVVETELAPYQRAIFRQYGLFAKGAGVLFEWLEVPQPCFGFAGSGLQPFNQAPFFAGAVTIPKFSNSTAAA